MMRVKRSMGDEHRVMLDNVELDNDDNRNLEQCRMKRGCCEVHKLKGDRLEVSSKRWGKVKYGYGWVTRKTVVWKCPHENRDADLGDATQFSVNTVNS